MSGASHDDLHRDFGRMEAGLDSLKEIVREGFKDNRERLDLVEQRLAALETRETERKGAWKVIVGITAIISGAVATFVTSLAKHLF